MQKFTFLYLFIIASINTEAQTGKSNNKSLDTLKQNIKAIGNLFKKAGAVFVTIEGIDSNDIHLSAFSQSIQKVTGVKKITNSYYQNKAVFTVSYKGKGSELWDAIPQNAKQIFSLTTLSDTSVKLGYKNGLASAGNPKNVALPTKGDETANNINVNGNGKSESLSRGAALLFKNIKTKLTDETKNTLLNSTGFKLSKDRKQFITDAESSEYPFDAFVYTTDLNKDGKEEVFILFGNSYTSGMTGSSIIVFIADRNGTYKMNLGFPGTLPDALSTANMGYPDLLIGGPGFEFPVWRWNGKAYDFFKQVKEKDLTKLKATSIQDISKAYAASIK